MKNTRSLFAVCLSGIILASCSTSNSVVNNHLISKRKYTKGFHINKKGHFGTDENDQLAKNEKEVKELKYREVAEATEKGEVTEGNNERAIQKTEVTGNATQKKSETANSNINSGADKVNTKRATDVIQGLNEQMRTESSAQKKNVAEKEMLPPAPDTGDPLMLVLAILLCLILPPVALAVFRGIDTIFWVDLILFLVAIGGFWFFSIAGLAGLVAVVLAFLGVFDVI